MQGSPLIANDTKLKNYINPISPHFSFTHIYTKLDTSGDINSSDPNRIAMCTGSPYYCDSPVLDIITTNTGVTQYPGVTLINKPTTPTIRPRGFNSVNSISMNQQIVEKFDSSTNLIPKYSMPSFMPGIKECIWAITGVMILNTYSAVTNGTNSEYWTCISKCTPPPGFAAISSCYTNPSSNIWVKYELVYPNSYKYVLTSINVSWLNPMTNIMDKDLVYENQKNFISFVVLKKIIEVL
jgi:hypothetical protein